jgi:hypothetical protein
MIYPVIVYMCGRTWIEEFLEQYVEDYILTKEMRGNKKLENRT